MDYGKSGNPKQSRREPRDITSNPFGAPKAYGAGANDKAAILAKMKAAAEKKAEDEKK